MLIRFNLEKPMNRQDAKGEQKLKIYWECVT